MNGNNILLDTNIIFYIVSGSMTLHRWYEKNVVLSFITEIELLSYPMLKQSEEQLLIKIIQESTVIEMDNEIKHYAIALRKKYSLRLPDAILLGTSLHHKIPFVTNDKALLKVNEVNVLVPFFQ